MCFWKKKLFIGKVFKKAAKTFEARDFLNMFLRFVCSFSDETFSYKKDLLVQFNPFVTFGKNMEI